jgi:hypothetical protein
MKNRAMSGFARARLPAVVCDTKTIAAVVLLVAGMLWAADAQPTTNFYVATNGNDSWNGKSPTYQGSGVGPFASLAKAQLAVEGVAGSTPVNVYIRKGTYYLPLSTTNPGTLTLGTADSGTSASPVVWENYRGENPFVSGGVPIGTGGLGLTWVKPAKGKLWHVTLPSGIRPFEYLFYTSNRNASRGPRRLRSRVQDSSGVGYYMKDVDGVETCYSTQTGNPAPNLSYCNLGTFLRVAATIAYDPNGSTCTLQNSDGTKCLDRFVYSASSPDPIRDWINLNGAPTGPPGSPCQTTSNTYPVGDIGLMLFDTWTVDDMRIGCIDTTNQIIYLIGATGTNSGASDLYGPTVGHRYIIENTKDAFNAAQATGQTGLWFLDRSSANPHGQMVLYYLANRGENPNRDTVVIPQLGGQFPQVANGRESNDYVGGSLISASNLSYVTFKGMTFEVDNFVPSYTTGFNNDANGEMSVPQAVDCENCQFVTFDSVTFTQTSASGLLIASTSGPPSCDASTPCAVIKNSTFADIGDSGIRIGHYPTSSDITAGVVQFVTVQNNLIDGYSRVFPDGEGIAQGNGRDVNYLHNDVVDGYHAGISVCQLTCPPVGVNGTNIVSKYNHLRNLMQGVTSDGGSLYYNVGGQDGSGSGDLIYNNLVHDTSDSSIIDTINGVRLAGSGYGGEGIYLDDQSGGIDVENNVVYHVSAFTAWMSSGPTVLNSPNPNTFANNIFSLGIRGMFGQQDPWPLLVNVQPAPSCGSGYQIGEQVKFYNNIFNFDLNEALPPPTADPSFHVVRGCADSCGLDYNRFEDFEGNAYWRAGTPQTGPLFCRDASAFYVLANPPVGAEADGNSCAQTPNSRNSKQFTFLTFDQPAGGARTWQQGEPPDPPGTPVPMNEDPQGTCSYNPGFGTTGNPSDYLLASAPPTPFNSALTNDTIRNAGRTSGSAAPTVPATFPTYSYDNTQF